MVSASRFFRRRLIPLIAAASSFCQETTGFLFARSCLAANAVAVTNMSFTMRPSRTSLSRGQRQEEMNQAAGHPTSTADFSLSREELRARRLASLERQTNNNQNRRCLDSSTSVQQQQPQPPRHQDVVDLCSDSDEDKEANKAKPRVRPAEPASAPSKRWKTSALSTKEDSTTTTFRVASYNIWFDPVEQQARMKALAACLLAATRPPVLIGFQEVTDSLAVHLVPLLERAGYTVTRQPDVPYGCAIAVQSSHRMDDAHFVPYTCTRMGRGILYVRVRLFQKTVLFCTTHLESWAGPHMTGAQERQQQLLELERFALQQLCDMRIITGDLNWDDVRPRSKGPDPVLLEHLRDKKWKDAWPTLYPKDPGYTYDGKTSPMLFNSLRRRFDRVLVHTNDFQLKAANLIGKEAIPGLVWDKPLGDDGRTRRASVLPSDHYGLVVELKTKA